MVVAVRGVFRICGDGACCDVFSFLVYCLMPPNRHVVFFFPPSRHLCEFTGLDLEMAITDHYNEVIFVLHNTFKVLVPHNTFKL